MNLGFNNNFNVDYTAPGFCSKCFTEVAEFKGSMEVSPGIYRPKIVALKPNYRKREVVLSNGSHMTVTLCEECHDIKPEDLPHIMESEIKGWKREAIDFALETNVDDWIKKVSLIRIIDVPEMAWDEETRKTLKENYAASK